MGIIVHKENQCYLKHPLKVKSISLNLFCLDQENTADQLGIFPSSGSVMAHGIQQLCFQAFANANNQEKNLKVTGFSYCG